MDVVVLCVCRGVTNLQKKGLVMVDSINPSGSIQNTQAVKSTTSKQSDSQKSEKSSASSVDEVQISEEALTLAQVEQAARDASGILANDALASLSNDAEKLNALV